MAEHTCVVAGSWNSEANRICPGCQEQHQALAAKETQVLSLVVALVNSDRGVDDGSLLRAGREYVELLRGLGRG